MLQMKKSLLSIVMAVYSVSAWGMTPELDAALTKLKNSCYGIADEFNHLKTMAGINTAVTGVGTVAATGAAVVGFKKADLDKQIAELGDDLCTDGCCDADTVENMSDVEFFSRCLQTMSQISQIQEMRSDIDKSKSLGNWRTGLMAGATATNVAGAVIASKNHASDDLRGAINECGAAARELRVAYMTARSAGVPANEWAGLDEIANACDKWDYVDLSKIDNRANGAMWSSIAGATLGAAGTVTSAVANSKGVRQYNTTDRGTGITDASAGKSESEIGALQSHERKLNTASNVLAVGTAAAGVTATVFNATQISTIKRGSEIADECERALATR